MVMSKWFRIAVVTVVTLTTLAGCGGSKNVKNNDVRVEGNNNKIILGNRGQQEADASNNKSDTGVDVKASGSLK